MNKILVQLFVIGSTMVLSDSFAQISPLQSAPPAALARKTPIKTYAFQSHVINTTCFVGKRDANSRVWFQVTTSQDSTGRIQSKTNLAYVELATGMHYWEDNQWKESKELIEPFSGGAISRFGQHKVIFANNLNTAGAIDLQTPDGKELRSHVIGLYYYDSSTGKSVLIAKVKDSIGQIVNSNQVVYADAFDGVSADVRYTYKLGSFEQDVILTAQPPPPQSYGLNPATTQLQVLTEFIDPPQPKKIARTIRQKDGTDSEDDYLDFGAMKFDRSKAFIGGNDASPQSGSRNNWSPATEIAVTKQWVQLDGRQFLVEKVSMPEMQKELETLPQAVSSASKRNRPMASKKRYLPSAPTAKIGKGTMQLAKLSTPAHGLVLDYKEVNTDQTGYTFKGDTTYYISAPMMLSGANVLEGGTCLKFANNTDGIKLFGTLTCNTTSYHPAILTSQDDDSVGELLPVSGHTPVKAGSFHPYLTYSFYYYGGYFSQNCVLKNIRVLYAGAGVYGDNVDLTDAQFVKCKYAVASGATDYSAVGLHNVLFSDCDCVAVVDIYPITITGEQVTVDQCPYLTSGCGSGHLINSILSDVTSLNDFGCFSWDGSNNGFYPQNSPQFGTGKFTVSTSPFQTDGAGNYYLTTASGFRGEGTTGVTPSLLADLKTKTTYPPIALPALMNVTGDLTLSPQVSRYTSGAPDLGYYYPALDYTVAGLYLEGGNITVLPGTAVGFRMDYIPAISDYTYFGFDSREGSSFISQGTPEKPNTFVDVQLVQEQSTPPIAASFQLDFNPTDENLPPPSLDFQFSDFYLIGNSYLGTPGYHFSGGYTGYGYEPTYDSAVFLDLRNCNFHGGQIDLGKTVLALNTGAAVSWFNNLFDRVAISIDPDWPDQGDPTPYVDLSFQAYNNLFRGGSWFHLEPIAATAGNWILNDNLFDKVDFVQDPSQPLDHDYNAYWQLTPDELTADYNQNNRVYPWNVQNTTELSPTESNVREFSAAPPYQTEPLGNYYLPTSTPLYNAGSRSAADAGLAQYTTQTSQTKDSGQVDIGLHYVATSSSTSATPKDTDADGIPDYVEDANGDGQFESGTETDWQNNYSTTDPNTGQPVADAYSTIYDNVDLDGDGLTGHAERILGANPLIQDNPLILTPVITGQEPSILTFAMPLGININSSQYTLKLIDNGQLANGYCFNYQANNTYLVQWNTTFAGNGFHILQVALSMPGANVPSNDTSDIQSVNQVFGPACFQNVNNLIQFDPNTSLFNSQAWIYGILQNQQSADYKIDIYDTATPPNLLKTITGHTGNGTIDEVWDLTDNQSQPRTDAEFDAVVTINTPPPIVSIPYPYHLLRSASYADGAFTMAFGWSSGFYLSDRQEMIQNNVVDVLFDPSQDNTYPNTFLNSFDGTCFYMGTTTDQNVLLDDLYNGNVKNFYWDGHGNDSAIGSAANASQANSGASYLTIGDIKDELLNVANTTFTGWVLRNHPYRLVILNSCDSAEDTSWANVFGIVGNTYPLEWFQRSNIDPQAFVGWPGDDIGPIYPPYFDTYGAHLYVLFELWMSEVPLEDCLNEAGASVPNQWFDMPLDNRWKIFGYPDLTRTPSQ